MAEYLKWRLTTAKVGVTMAFLALLAGVSEKASAAPANGSPGTTRFFNDVSNPLAGGLDHALIKLQQKFVKLDNALVRLTDTLHKDYPTWREADATFLKTTDLSRAFYLCCKNEYLSTNGTAANSNELGGLAPSAFVQGHANVVSAMASLSKGSMSATLLQTPDGMITVKVMQNLDGTVNLVLHNNTSVNLTAITGDPTAVELPAGGDSQAILIGLLNANTSAVSDHLQILPAGSFNRLMTLTVSAEQPTTGGATEVVGQMVDGSV